MKTEDWEGRLERWKQTCLHALSHREGNNAGEEEHGGQSAHMGGPPQQRLALSLHLSLSPAQNPKEMLTKWSVTSKEGKSRCCWAAGCPDVASKV